MQYSKKKKLALSIGIDHYPNDNDLSGCVQDAKRIISALENDFDCHLLTSKRCKQYISIIRRSPDLKEKESMAISHETIIKEIEELFGMEEAEMALLYFAGHGIQDATGAYLWIPNSLTNGCNGIPMNAILKIANKSKIKDKIIILDCCHSGSIGLECYTESFCKLGEGVSILASCKASECAKETRGHGDFSALLINALTNYKCYAADRYGDIHLAGLYAYIANNMGSWSQRPIFRANVSSFEPIIHYEPQIDSKHQIRVAGLFGKKDRLKLDKSYLETEKNSKPDNVNIFKELLDLERLGLVSAFSGKDMQTTAKRGWHCSLTQLGIINRDKGLLLIQR